MLTRRPRLLLGFALLALAGGAARLGAQCPSVEEGLAYLEELPLEKGARAESFELLPPQDLYREAFDNQGDVIVERDGKLGLAVMVADIPVEAMWMALNDDDHHDEGDFLPLRESQVIEGEPASEHRETFQYFKKAGLGRWWVNRLDMNEDLYHETDGGVWELRWEDVLDEYPDEEPPVEINARVPPLVESLGAWLLVPLSPDCILVEYVARGEPGGMVGALQWLAATRTIRSTVEGMVEIARSHLDEPHRSVLFVRPDGTPLGSIADGAPEE